MSRRLAWSGPAERELARLERTTGERVRQAVARYLATDHGDVIRLQGVNPPGWRLRVGDHRVLFHFQDAAPDDKDRREWLLVDHVLHRREAYR